MGLGGLESCHTQHPSVAMEGHSDPRPSTNSCCHTGEPPLTFDLWKSHHFCQLSCTLCSHLGLISQTRLWCLSRGSHGDLLPSVCFCLIQGTDSKLCHLSSRMQMAAQTWAPEETLSKGWLKEVARLGGYQASLFLSVQCPLCPR